jgi:aspartate/glutamate racemase
LTVVIVGSFAYRSKWELLAKAIASTANHLESIDADDLHLCCNNMDIPQLTVHHSIVQPVHDTLRVDRD